jgi:hypothetical protein
MEATTSRVGVKTTPAKTALAALTDYAVTHTLKKLAWTVTSFGLTLVAILEKSLKIVVYVILAPRLIQYQCAWPLPKFIVSVATTAMFIGSTLATSSAKLPKPVSPIRSA